MAINETATGNDSVAVTGTASAGDRTVGVKGIGDSVGVLGVGKSWHGVEGSSDSTIGGFGVHGVHTKGGTGVVGESTGWIAVGGFATAESKGAAVYGEHKGLQAGVWGNNLNDTNDAGAGVAGESKRGVGVWAKGGRLAGLFEGDVEVTGDIRLTNADCAEDFDICDTEQIEPGMVMVLGEDGKLTPSEKAYDKRVAGVVSGAGDCRPGIILGRQQLQGNRMPVALVGKVHCKVDASYSPIEVGDLLTTSPTPGCAMKADDHVKAFGAVIGKALRRLDAGLGLIPVLVALQ
jgi:hypothetical protein